ncbi:MAG: protein kinase [Candidatus Melainabacteria bacterium]|nr:protein kinase [Candidatus Melainabacteria bacterium]
MKPAEDRRIMEYSDWISAFCLWWKAVLLLPAWGVLVAACLGAVMWRLGLPFVEAGYALVLAGGIAYFVEDLLKRKIKIENGTLYLGFRRFQLAGLHSVKVTYNPKRIIPEALTFSFQDGKLFHLWLSRLQAVDIQYLVDLIDTRYPHCKVDPVLRHLARCHELSPVLKDADDGPVSIRYQSNKMVSEMKESFLSMYRSWSRLGPGLAMLLCTPMWAVFAFGSFSLFKIVDTAKADSLLQESLVKISSDVDKWIGELVGTAFSRAGDLATNPVVGSVAAVVTLAILGRIILNLLEPNEICLDPGFLNLRKKIIGWSVNRAQIPWDKITGAVLVRPESSDQGGWRISLRGDGKELKSLRLEALDQDGRRNFLRRLKIFAPACVIDAELEEALIPSQRKSYTELWLQSLASSPERKNLKPLTPGHRLQEGRYEVVRKLGVGGQGAAYLCRVDTMIQAELCQEVVLKETIMPVFVDDSIRKQSLERFEHEARLLESLDHPHIVKMIDFFVEDHRGYLILDHLEGSNLRERTLREPLSEEEVRALIPRMCDLLAYLHEKNVLHRDFTPDNLILTRSGELKLIDFNVAQVASTGMTGTVVGKHAYVPPEQFRGKPTEQSDIYAMGCTIYFLLTGKDPEPLTQSSVKKERGDIDTVIDTIVKTCTAIRPEHRFKSAASITSLLEEGAEYAGSEEGESLTISLKEKEKQTELS